VPSLLKVDRPPKALFNRVDQTLSLPCMSQYVARTTFERRGWDGLKVLPLKKVVPLNMDGVTDGVVEMPVHHGLNISGVLAPASSHRALLVVTVDRRRCVSTKRDPGTGGRPGRFRCTSHLVPLPSAHIPSRRTGRGAPCGHVERYRW
jgi:hypothetical protein